MKNKIFLTSIFAIAFACPAFAIDGNATIENGDTCNVDNLGTSTNNSTANLEAIWTLQSIECPAGTSFNASTASCDTCSAGSWCVAGTYDVENNATGAGATSCSTLSNGDYPLSESGSSANTACYRNCANADVAHSSGTVNGSVFYNGTNGDGTKTCEPTNCVNGWHVKPANMDLSQYNDNPTSSDFPKAYIKNDGIFRTEKVQNIQQPESYFGLTQNNTWATDLGNITIRGEALCSTTPGVHPAYMEQTGEGDILTSLTDETGQTGAQYCYCRIIDARTSAQSPWQMASSAWVYYGTIGPGGVDYCTSSCASQCPWTVGTTAGFRNALFNSVVPGLASCEANNIGLAWYNDTVANNGTTITPNNSAANQCSYSGTITVPTNTMEKAGYTFGGWKLRTTTQPAQ